MIKTIYLEQYFTKPDVAKDSIQIILDDLNNIRKVGINRINSVHFIEPACGQGAFVKQLKSVNQNFKITSLDIDNLYEEAIVYDFFQTDRRILNIQKNEITIFFGCPPSLLTKEFIQHCKKINGKAIVYFILEKSRLEACIKDKIIVFYSILKNYGHHTSYFKNENHTSLNPFLLTRIILENN